MPNNVLLKNIPQDILKIILDKQVAMKIAKPLTKQISICAAVYKIIGDAESTNRIYEEKQSSVCSCGNELTEKELFYETCLKCDKTPD